MLHYLERICNLFFVEYCSSIKCRTVESRFLEPPGEKQVGSGNRRVREIGGKITVFDLRRGNDFWFELSGGSKK